MLRKGLCGGALVLLSLATLPARQGAVAADRAHAGQPDLHGRRSP
jgi:hypothetical protein